MADEKERERKFAKDFLEKWARAEREDRPAAEVLDDVERQLKERPEDPELWFRKGVLLSDLERWGEALAALRRAESLNPQLPQLHVALSLVLGHLGRPDEAAIEQTRALETPADAPKAPEDDQVEEALESLTKDLHGHLEEEAKEAEAVKGLEELESLATAESPPEEPPEARMARWAATGYDVAPLRDILEKDPDRARTALFQFEQNIRKVQVLEETVKTLTPTGIEKDIARVRQLFRSPYQIWRIEAQMAMLLEKAEERERASRARTVPSPAPRPGAIARPPGATNGKGGINGRGAINGRGTGRVNGATGRVNGMINGVQRARSGLTNGLTNGLGFTNGLAATRFRAEARKRRWRLFLVPMVAVLLLSVPLLAPPPPELVLGGAFIDGLFSDWQGVPAYAQPSTTANPNVDLASYAVRFQDDRLSIYAKVRGGWFADTTDLDLFFAFVDGDGDAATGYDEGRVGAEFLVEVNGGNGTVAGQNAWSWTGADPGNWSAWERFGGDLRAASTGPGLELQIDLTEANATGAPFDAGRAAVVLFADDQAGAQSESIAFGIAAHGALEATQQPIGTTIAQGTAEDLVLVTFRAIGSSVNVTGLTFARGTGTPAPAGFAAMRLLDGASAPVMLTIDTSSAAPGTFFFADLSGVAADRPVTILGGAVRSYLGGRPPGWTIDGVFEEWNATLPDSDAVANPDVDVQRDAHESQNGTAFAYVGVRGTALGGTPAPLLRIRSRPGQASPPSPPGTPERRAGEDLLRVFYDTNATDEGIPVGGIVADAYLEVRGRHGRVRGAQGFVWQAGGWVALGTAEADAEGSELEASLALPGRDLRGADVVLEARDWKGTTDRTAAGGVRGTRSSPADVTFFRAYDATLPRAAGGRVTFAVGDRGVSWSLPDLAIERSGSRDPLASPGPISRIDGDSVAYSYEGFEATLGYELAADVLKETVVLAAPPPAEGPETLVVGAELSWSSDLLVDASGSPTSEGLLVDGAFAFTDGRGFSASMLTPWAIDASGSRLDLTYRWSPDRLSILVPAAWLAAAAYPVVIDPTTTFQIENDGASEDPGEQMGYASAIGDFNDDGYADLLTGAPRNDLGGNVHGYAYVFYGPLDANDSTPDVRIKGTSTDAQHGYSVAAGKFNGDAFWDALVASRSASTITGNVSIYYGGSSWSGLETTPDVNFTWPSSPQNFGWWVAAGNIDNANNDDVLISEPGRDNDGGLPSQDGAVHVFMSPFSTPETAADFTLKPSTNAGGQFGYSIAVGKIDSDAYADVVVGEPFETTNRGRVHLFKGVGMTSGSGDRSPNATLTAPTATEKFGFSVALGFINGDAYADLGVGAPAKSSNMGTAHVFLANSDGSGLTTDASPDATIAGISATEQMGSSIAVVDFDDDGSAGVFVGAPTADVGGTDRGRAYWFDSPIADQTVDETITGTQDGERLGISVTAGKFGSDTKTRVAIGAHLWDDTGQADSGRVLIAEVPEFPAAIAPVAVILTLALGLVKRRRLVRQR